MSALQRQQQRAKRQQTSILIRDRRNKRMARTRTLIQIGGLAEKAGLLDLLNLRSADSYTDLQIGGTEAMKAAAILYAAMQKVAEMVRDPDQKASLLSEGRRLFREEENDPAPPYSDIAG